MYCGAVRQVIDDERNGDLSSDTRDVMKPSRFSFQAPQISMTLYLRTFTDMSE